MSVQKKVSFLEKKADMALKASRYEEAQEVYEECLQLSSSSQLWLGLAKTKILRLPEGQKMFEVIDCIKEAKKGSKGITEVDHEILNLSLELLSSFTKSSVSQLKFIYDEEVKAALAGVASAVFGAASLLEAGASLGDRKISKSALGFGAISGAAGAYHLCKKKNVQTSEEALDIMTNFFNEIHEALEEFYKDHKNNKYVSKFFLKITKYETEIQVAHPIKRKEYIYEKLNKIWDVIASDSINKIPFFEKTAKERKQIANKIKKEEIFFSSLSEPIDKIKVFKNKFKENAKSKIMTLKKVDEDKIRALHIFLKNNREFEYDSDGAKQLNDAFQNVDNLTSELEALDGSFLNKAKSLIIKGKIALENGAVDVRSKKLAKEIVEAEKELVLKFNKDIDENIRNLEKDKKAALRKFNTFIKKNLKEVQTICVEFKADFKDLSSEDEESISNFIKQLIDHLVTLKGDSESKIEELNDKNYECLSSAYAKLLSTKNPKEAELGPIFDIFCSLPEDGTSAEYCEVVEELRPKSVWEELKEGFTPSLSNAPWTLLKD